MAEVKETPIEITEMVIESFWKEEKDGVYYYWRPLHAENRRWYKKKTPHKQIPYKELWPKKIDQVFQDMLK